MIKDGRSKTQLAPPRIIVAMLPLAACLMIAGCVDSKGEDGSGERDAIEATVSTFIQEAYDDEGDWEIAYNLMDSETRRSCSMAEFERLVAAARDLIAGEKLEIRAIEDIQIAGELATLRVRLTVDGTRAWFLQERLTVVREEGRWRYRETRNPECDEPADFFRLGTPLPVTTAPPLAPECEPAYPLICVPRYPPDLDCSDIEERRFLVLEPDPHGFDPDGDTFGCED